VVLSVLAVSGRQQRDTYRSRRVVARDDQELIPCPGAADRV